SHTRFASSLTPGPCYSPPSSDSGRANLTKHELCSQIAASPFLYALLRAVRRAPVDGPLAPPPVPFVELRYERRSEFRGDVIEGVPIILSTNIISIESIKQ